MTRRYAVWCFLASAFGICAWLMTMLALDTGYVEEAWKPTLAILPHIGWYGMLVLMASKGFVMYILYIANEWAETPAWIPWSLGLPMTLGAMVDALNNCYVWTQLWHSGMVRLL